MSLPYKLFLPCAYGVEEYLADEIHRITGRKGSDLLTSRTGAHVNGTFVDMMRLNLHSRLAQRVLLQLSSKPYQNEQDLYQIAMDVPWEQWFTVSMTFKIEVTAQHSPLKSLDFVALKIKDALCDRFRSRTKGERPTVARDSPDVRVYVHLTDTQSILYIDTSGDGLFKRGWRRNTGDAPLKETLASAMLMACNWTDKVSELVPLYDPCCGSGTIAIEAAQIAANIAPGIQRQFAFEQYVTHQPKVWQELKNQAKAAILPAPSNPFIFGSDVAHRMVDFAQQNAENANVNEWIEFRGGDALQRMPPCTRTGILLLNPPYGERIEVAGVSARGRLTNKVLNPRERIFSDDASGDGASFFAQLATHWKHHYANWQAWILTPDMKLPSKMRFKESRRVPMWNGPIECRLFRFDLLPLKNTTVKNTEIDSTF
jgi:putative N6-adenine-specific DNA methylase